MDRSTLVSVGLLAWIAGCPETHPGLADAWTADTVVVADAHRVDGSWVDAGVLDAGEVAGMDAFILPDAWAPAELCNGVDEDDDSLVDEGAQADCRVAPGAGEAVCIGGACRCREEGALAHAGAFADCNGDWRDGCETALDSPVSCGGCGVVCDAVSECTDTEVGGLRCRPMGILDFSLSRRDGEISCVVGLDHRVLCRGPNAAHAISDAAEESATLDWTVLDVPASSGVRADLHVRADGTEVMTVCVITTEGDVVCRGGNDTGLLGYGDREPRAGNHRIALPEAVYRLEIRQGDAYAMFGTDTTEARLWRWAGDDALAPREWVARVFHFALGNMPMAAMIGTSPAPGTTTFEYTVSWGPHHDRLANRADSEPPWSGPTAAVAFGGPSVSIACERDVCCRFTGTNVMCWGRETWWLEGHAFQPYGAYVLTEPPHGRREDGYLSYFESTYHGRYDREDIRMAPMPGGGVEVCLGRAIPDEEFEWFERRVPALYCLDARALAAAPPGPVFEPLLLGDPDRYSPDRRPARTRPDWDAMCLDLAPNHWRCWGLHEGWGHPAIP